MDWRDIPSLAALRAFESAVRLGSLSAAARELNVTHAAVSQHVRRLESHFGCPLLVRDGQRMVATEDGAPLAEGLTAGFGTIAAAVRDLAERDRLRPLRIAVTPSFAAGWLLPRLHGFWARHPEIEVEILPSVALADLRRDGVDAAVRYGHGDWPGTHSEMLLPAGFVVVARPGLVPGGVVSDLSRLRDQTWLLRQGPLEERFFAEANGLDLSQVAALRILANDELVREAVRAGMGITAMPEPVAAAEIAAGRLVAVYRETDADVAYHLLTRPERTGPALMTFLRWLRAEAAADRAAAVA